MQRTALITGFAVLCLCMASCGAPAWARPLIKVGVRGISPPFSFLTKEHGKTVLQGYSIDEWTRIGELLGVDVKFIQTANLRERREMLIDGRIDFMAHGTRQEAEQMGYAYIPVGFSYMHQFYATDEALDNLTLSGLADKRTVVIIGAIYSKSELKLVKNVKYAVSTPDALNMLRNHEADVYLSPSKRETDYILSEQDITGIRPIGKAVGENSCGMLVPPDKPALENQIRCAINQMEENGFLARLRSKWFGLPEERTRRQQAKHILWAASGAGLLILLVAMWNLCLKRRVGRATRECRQTEERYRNLIEFSPDMIFLVNENGDIFHANDRARTTLLFPPHDDPWNIEQIMVEGNAKEMHRFLHGIFNDESDKQEFVMLSASKHPIEVEIAGRIIQQPSPVPLLACLFARNVTERNRMEQELLQSERLSIIGRMAASVAHEINNPVGIIKANADVLLYSKSFDEDVVESLTAIQRNAIRAGEITKGLLEFSSPKPLVMELLHVKELVTDSICLLGAKAKGRDIRIEVQDGLFIRGNQSALQQVLINLLFNSLNNMDKSGTISIIGSRRKKNGSAIVRLDVGDTGSGIPPEYLAQVFEPFFSMRKGGFGLGLFFTRYMVERHNGIITAESRVGVGTHMILEFPICNPSET